MDRRSFLAATTTAAASVALPAAAPWATGKFNLSWREKGVSGWKEVAGVVRGCWGIHQDTAPEAPGYTLTHLPSGYRAGWSEDEGVMERFAAMLDGLTDFSNENHETVMEKDLTPPVKLAAQKAGFINLGGSEWALA